MTTRRCTRCQQLKELDTGFHVSRRAPDGRATICKVCRNEHNRALYQQDPLHRIQEVREWQRANPDKYAEYNARKTERRRANKQT